MGTLLESLKQGLMPDLLSLHVPSDDRAFARVKPESIRRCVAHLWGAGGRLATMTGIEVRDGIEVNYHFCFDDHRLVLTLSAVACWPQPSLESVAQDIPGALWIEREIHDILGVDFQGHPDMRRLILPDDWPEGIHPLRRGFTA